MKLYCDQINTSEGTVSFIVDEGGLVYIGGFNQAFESEILEKFSNSPIELTQDSMTDTFREMLLEYFSGKRKQFDCPISLLSGTPFQKKVWASLINIPYGETRTYSEIASQVGHPSAVRAVASAIGKNPIAIVIPCHRVIGKDGRLRGYRGGLAMKEWLLNHERSVLDKGE